MKLSDLEIVVQIRRRGTEEVLFGRKDVWYADDCEWGELHQSFDGPIDGEDRAQRIRRGLLRAVDGAADELRDHLELIWGIE